MRILVEASAACNQGAGIGRYSRNILQRLIPMASEDSFTLLRAPAVNEPSRFDVDPWPNARLRNVPFNRRNADRIWFRLGLPLDARVFGGAADVVYSPDFTAPPMWHVPRMITVHDLAFLTHPEHTTDALRGFMESVVAKQVAGADLVAVVSEATKADVMRYYGVPESRIVVAPNAADESFYTARPSTEGDRNRIGVPERYLLMLGTIEPRKNHLNALQAFEHAQIAESHPLVIVGRPGWGHEAAMKKISALQRQGKVLHLTNVTDADIPGIIAGATAMVYPSWTEGFGLPVVEAMAAGVQVITSTAPALREVGGPLAMYADPDDIDTLAAHMRAVTETADTAAEAAARVEWTRQFSWDSSTSTVYDAVKTLNRKSRQ